MDINIVQCVENTGYDCITWVENIFQDFKKKNTPVILY